MTIRSFGASARSRSSANVAAKGQLKSNRPDPKTVGFEANVVLRPDWMHPDYEDCYLLGRLMRLLKGELANGGVLTRSEICEKIFGRAAISEDEDNKLNRCMWELHRMGVVNLTSQETGK